MTVTLALGLTLCALYALLKLSEVFFPRYFHAKLYYAPSTFPVLVKSPSNTKEVREESLRHFVETRCPSLHKEFRPAWWLFSGHLQTGYSVVGDFSKVDKVDYERTTLRTLDGGTIGLDFAPLEHDRKLKDDTPIVVVKHGLTGGSHEAYVRAVLAPVCAPLEEGGLGYRAVVCNFRGCAGVPITSPQLYSAGHTDDLRVAVYYLRKRYPRAPLLGLGFSLGANVLTRYLAEEGENSRIVAACLLACPWDLLKNSEATAFSLEGRWFHRTVYSSALGTNLQNIVRRHAASLSKHADTAVAQAVAPLLALKGPTMEAFDSTFNRFAGGSSPPFPFPSAQAYYVWASSHDKLGAVRVPLLALNAEDDPIVQVLPVGGGGNPRVVFAVTRRGGHLGWFEVGARAGEVRRWFRGPVVEWLRAVGEDMVLGERAGRPLHEEDGYLKEEGRDDIGCMEVEVGGRVVGVEGQEGVLAGLSTVLWSLRWGFQNTDGILGTRHVMVRVVSAIASVETQAWKSHSVADTKHGKQDNGILSDARRDTVTAEAILMIKSHSVRVPSVSVDHHAKCNARTEGGLLRQQTVSSIKLMTGLAPGTGGWMASVRACVCNGRVEDRSKVVRGTPRGTSLSKGTCHPPSDNWALRVYGTLEKRLRVLFRVPTMALLNQEIPLVGIHSSHRVLPDNINERHFAM
ncbi:hypothetical protein IEO21_02029 [Rhodonia placenta]|uniref:AB hydrolase-1 domain-containing protein n=1 Tax=Rhodonia placenta TaxID=104341 RepID=A0A8H7P8P4_9APHY|nr:hypothetical protein IEO21_02029 [Postia placenta]